jgi:hypothetical protein
MAARHSASARAAVVSSYRRTAFADKIRRGGLPRQALKVRLTLLREKSHN